MSFLEKVMRKRHEEDKMKITALQREGHQTRGKNLDTGWGWARWVATLTSLHSRWEIRGRQTGSGTAGPISGCSTVSGQRPWTTLAAGSPPSPPVWQIDITLQPFKSSTMGVWGGLLPPPPTPHLSNDYQPTMEVDTLLLAQMLKPEGAGNSEGKKGVKGGVDSSQPP